MMKDENIAKNLESEDNSLFNVLHKLEHELETEGPRLMEEIKGLKAFCDDIRREAFKPLNKITSRRFDYDPRHGDIYHYFNEHGTRVENSEYCRLNDEANKEYSKKAGSSAKALEQKTFDLRDIYGQYQYTLVLCYFKCFESFSTTNKNLADLYKSQQKFQKFLMALNDLIGLVSISPITIKLNSTASQLLIEISSSYQNYSSINGVSLEDKFVKFKFPSKSESESRHAPTHLNTPLIMTSFFDNYNHSFIDGLNLQNNIWANNYNGSHFNDIGIFFEAMFSKESIIGRILLAIVLDNPIILKLFFEEYKKHYPTEALEDFIANNALIGMAAANGCVNVMKLFIDMKVNLEQKFTLNLSQSSGIMLPINPKSVLMTKYKESKLEMTPLALALSVAPALTKREASPMIDILLQAGANYKNKVVRKWEEMRGYYNNQHSIERSSTITLFDFDQTGILSESVNKLRSNVRKPSRKKVISGSDRMITFQDSSQLIKLQSEVERLKKRNVSLEEEVANLKLENEKLKQEVKMFKSTLSQSHESATIIQAVARGFFARKEYKNKIKHEVKSKEMEIKHKLVEADKMDI